MNILSHHSEYVREEMKNQEYLEQIKQSLLEVLETWGLSRFGIQYSQIISISSELGYYLLCLLLSRFKLKQTLGQEYVSTAFANWEEVQTTEKVLVSTNYPKAAYFFRPGPIKTIIYLFLRFCIPSITRNLCSKARFNIDLVLDIIKNSHLAVFCREGLFYGLAERLTNIIQLKLNRKSSESGIYKVLFFMLSIQVVVEFYELYKQANRTLVEEKGNNEEIGGECVLCLGSLRSPTATICGHVYCWNCILTSLQTSPQCPICREPNKPQQLLQLRN